MCHVSVGNTHTSGFNTGGDSQNKWLLLPLHSACPRGPLRGDRGGGRAPGRPRRLGELWAQPASARSRGPQEGSGRGGGAPPCRRLSGGLRAGGPRSPVSRSPLPLRARLARGRPPGGCHRPPRLFGLPSLATRASQPSPPPCLPQPSASRASPASPASHLPGLQRRAGRAGFAALYSHGCCGRCLAKLRWSLGTRRVSHACPELRPCCPRRRPLQRLAAPAPQAVLSGVPQPPSPSSVCELNAPQEWRLHKLWLLVFIRPYFVH